MNAFPWHGEFQNRRRQELYARHRTLLRQIFTADGQYLGDPAAALAPEMKPRPCDPRVLTYHCFPAMAGGQADIELANGILRHADFLPEYDFFVSALLLLYARHRDKFAPDILLRARACLETAGPTQLDGPGFVGMNDNFPAMEVLCLILLGELTARPELLQNGIAKLRQLVARLDEYGTIAEYGSPSYTPITLCCLAEIVNFAGAAEARALALRVEQQIWYDLCARFHPGTSQYGGPSSRSYTNGSCGHMHNGRFLMHVVFGPEIQALSPLRYAYGRDPRLVIHHNDRGFVIAGGAFIAAPEYHPPEAGAALLAKRPYPFQIIATAACASIWCPDEWRHTKNDPEPRPFRKFETYQYGQTLLTTFQTPEYCLGSASGIPACGTGSQQEAFFLSYRRRSIQSTAELGIEDVRTVFRRYVFEEKQPATAALLLPDEGVKTCLQHEGTVLVLERPANIPPSGITSMRTVIILPVHCNLPDEVVLGTRSLAGFEGEEKEAKTVFVRDGLTFLAFRPLELTNYGRPAAVRVRRVENFLTISFYNYEGPPRSLNFPVQAALFTRNGFVMEVASAQKAGSFAAFQEQVNQALLRDEVEQGVRTVSYSRPDLLLELKYDPAADDRIPPAWINGKARATPRFSCTGLPGLPWPLHK